jgi:chloramphenicol 3-O phosphotransferase
VGTSSPGQIVILNGAPRSGKTSIAQALQEDGPGVWVNLGVDASNNSLPERFRPGIGLRPGGERPDLEELVVALYAALWDSVAAHVRLGLNVVVDAGFHDAYSAPRQIVPDAARRLGDSCVLVVGVRCPIEVIWERRRESWGRGLADADDQTVAAVERWQSAVHDSFDYDLEVDTASFSPERCAEAIVARLDGPPGTCLAMAASI